MELIDLDLLAIFLRYGVFAIGWGLVIIVPLEVLIFGVMKAFRLLRL